MRLDPDQFTKIFHELFPRLCQFLECLLGNSNLAQDLAQETLLRLYHADIDHLPGDEIRFWVFRVARNLAYNELKRERNQIRLITKFIDSFISIFYKSPVNPETNIVQNENMQLLIKLLKSLPADQATALLLREQEEMSYAEIAKVLSISEDKVKVDIFRARKMLREKYLSANKNITSIEEWHRRRR